MSITLFRIHSSTNKYKFNKAIFLGIFMCCILFYKVRKETLKLRLTQNTDYQSLPQSQELI